MSTKIYVGNLARVTTSAALEQLFRTHGEVRSVEMIMDRFSGQPKGFGFVEMVSDQGAQAAIDAINGSEVDGRTLTVNKARPREERGGGGGRGAYGGRNRR
jgi:RNA recognition motif-containing protein